MVAVIVFLTFLVSTGLTFIITPVANDLGMDETSIEAALAVPSITSLLIIFVAGQLGDRIGYREAVVWLAGVFALGGLVLTVASGVLLLSLGLGLCGAAATGIQVVGLGLLQKSVPDGRPHISAFTTFGMVLPIALLLLPLFTALLLDAFGWRVVMLIWVVAGIIMVLLILSLVKPIKVDQKEKKQGWLAPILTGIAFAGAARLFIEVGNSTATSARALLGTGIALVAGILLVILHRRRQQPGFIVRARRHPWLSALMFGVGMVSMVGTLTFVTLALKSLYGLDEFQAALAFVPPQIGGVLGAKVIADRMMHRFSMATSARVLMFALAASFVPLLFFQASFSMWYLIGSATLFNTMVFATITVLNTEVMARGPAATPGQTSSFRGASSALGSAMAVVVLGSSVLAAIKISTPTGEMSPAQLDQLAQGLRLDGLLAIVATLLAGGLLLIVGKHAKLGSSVIARP